MTNVKVAQGPWTAGKYNMVSTVFLERGNGTVPIATIHDIAADGDAEANARLIAAAPDLLAACKRLVGAIEAFAVAEKGGPFVNWAAVDASQDRARAAIARAEGGATNG